MHRVGRIGKVRRSQWPRISQGALAKSLGNGWTQTRVSLVETGKIVVTPAQEKVILQMVARLHKYDLQIRAELAKLKLPEPPMAEINDSE